METILLVNTIAALIGAYFVSKGKSLGFLIWIGTNIIFCMNNYQIGQWQQAFLFSAYLILAIDGYKNFKRLEKAKT